MKSLFALSLVLMFAAGPRVWAQTKDLTASQVAAYVAMTKADRSRDQGDIPAALTAYEDALAKYGAIQKQDPRWHPDVVQYRLTYCANEIEKLKKPAVQEAPPEEPAPTETASAVAGEDPLDALFGAVSDAEGGSTAVETSAAEIAPVAEAPVPAPAAPAVAAASSEPDADEALYEDSLDALLNDASPAEGDAPPVAEPVPVQEVAAALVEETPAPAAQPEEMADDLDSLLVDAEVDAPAATESENEVLMPAPDEAVAQEISAAVVTEPVTPGPTEVVAADVTPAPEETMQEEVVAMEASEEPQPAQTEPATAVPGEIDLIAMQREIEELRATLKAMQSGGASAAVAEEAAPNAELAGIDAAAAVVDEEVADADRMEAHSEAMTAAEPGADAVESAPAVTADERRQEALRRMQEFKAVRGTRSSAARPPREKGGAGGLLGKFRKPETEPTPAIDPVRDEAAAVPVESAGTVAQPAPEVVVERETVLLDAPEEVESSEAAPELAVEPAPEEPVAVETIEAVVAPEPAPAETIVEREPAVGVGSPVEVEIKEVQDLIAATRDALQSAIDEQAAFAAQLDASLADESAPAKDIAVPVEKVSSAAASSAAEAKVGRLTEQLKVLREESLRRAERIRQLERENAELRKGG